MDPFWGYPIYGNLHKKDHDIPEDIQLRSASRLSSAGVGAPGPRAGHQGRVSGMENGGFWQDVC